MDLTDLSRGPLTGRPLRSAEIAFGFSLFPMTRREFLGSSLAVSSLALTQSDALADGTSPDFLVETTRFVVSWGGGSWTVDCASFDGDPILTVVRNGSAYQGYLRGALFASINLSADLDFEISQTAPGTWRFFLSISALSIAAKQDLAEWLASKSFPIPVTPALLAGGLPWAKFAVRGELKSIDNLWRIGFGLGSMLAVGDRELVADALSVTLCGNRLPSSPTANPRMMIDAASVRLTGEDEWLRAMYKNSNHLTFAARG